MATETAELRASHRRSLKVTVIITLGGTLAGIITPTIASGPRDTTAVLVVLGAILAELLLMRLVGVDIQDFGTKDHLYVSFMTFSMWFIVWTILLTAGTRII